MNQQLLEVNLLVEITLLSLNIFTVHRYRFLPQLLYGQLGSLFHDTPSLTVLLAPQTSIFALLKEFVPGSDQLKLRFCACEVVVIEKSNAIVISCIYLIIDYLKVII